MHHPPLEAAAVSAEKHRLICRSPSWNKAREGFFHSQRDRALRSGGNDLPRAEHGRSPHPPDAAHSPARPAAEGVLVADVFGGRAFVFSPDGDGAATAVGVGSFSR
jgi:hypothetical protein